MTLELFLKNLPRNAYLCRDVGDCAPRYLRADSCAAPVILGALGDKVIGDVAGRLIPLQAEKRKNCPESKVACSPVTVPYDCVKNLCAELPQ